MAKKAEVKKTLKSIKVIEKQNPRRPGTAAHKFYDAMAKSKTVDAYLGRFKDKKARRNAALWLNANIRDGYAKVAA